MHLNELLLGYTLCGRGEGVGGRDEKRVRALDRLFRLGIGKEAGDRRVRLHSVSLLELRSIVRSVSSRGFV